MEAKEAVEATDVVKSIESEDSEFAPRDRIEGVYSRLDEALAMPESGEQALLLEDSFTTCNNLSMCYELIAQRHGELSKNCA